MLEIIIYIAAGVLSLIGLVEIIRTVALFIITERGSPDQLMLVLLNDRNAEAALRGAVERVRLLGFRCCRQVVAVDTGMSPESVEICRRFCDEYGCVMLCSVERLYELLSSMSEKKEKTTADAASSPDDLS